MKSQSHLFLQVCLMALAVFVVNSTWAATVTVKASMAGGCVVTDGENTELQFGALSPTATAPATGTAKITLVCTSGSPYDIQLDLGTHQEAGKRRMVNSGNSSAFLAYDLVSSPEGTGTGTGTELVVTLNGEIALEDIKTAAQGDFTDTVNVTFEP
jgi:spore coat protein U-like protein